MLAASGVLATPGAFNTHDMLATSSLTIALALRGSLLLWRRSLLRLVNGDFNDGSCRWRVLSLRWWCLDRRLGWLSLLGWRWWRLRGGLGLSDIALHAEVEVGKVVADVAEAVAAIFTMAQLRALSIAWMQTRPGYRNLLVTLYADGVWNLVCKHTFTALIDVNNREAQVAWERTIADLVLQVLEARRAAAVLGRVESKDCDGARISLRSRGVDCRHRIDVGDVVRIACDRIRSESERRRSECEKEKHVCDAVNEVRWRSNVVRLVLRVRCRILKVAAEEGLYVSRGRRGDDSKFEAVSSI